MICNRQNTEKALVAQNASKKKRKNSATDTKNELAKKLSLAIESMRLRAPHVFVVRNRKQQENDQAVPLARVRELESEYIHGTLARFQWYCRPDERAPSGFGSFCTV